MSTPHGLCEQRLSSCCAAQLSSFSKKPVFSLAVVVSARIALWLIRFDRSDGSLALLGSYRSRGIPHHASLVRGLGEIALRVDNLDSMQQFYEEVIGLPLMTRVPNCAFFKIADGYGGHPQVLALFDRSERPSYRGTNAAKSTIDHVAFEIAFADFEGEKKRLEGQGLPVETAEHAWVHWSSLYVNDPEGNRVELVYYDGSV